MFQLLSTTALLPSPLNPRKHFDEAKLQELADSMQNGVGVIEPIVARANGKPGTFEIIAGERRWRAATKAGLDQVPVIVKSMSDAQVVELMLIENGQREDINALEEGAGYKQALKIGAFKDVDALAEHVGKSRRHVYDTLKLVDDLIPEVKTLLDRGLITASHAVLISRLPADKQKEIVEVDDDYNRVYGHKSPLFEHEHTLREEDHDDDEYDRLAGKDPYHGLKAKSVRELERWIAEHHRFDPKVRVNRDVYAETAAAVEASPKVVYITHYHQVNPDAKEGNTQRIYSCVSWKRADGKRGSTPCDKSVLGLVVVGPEYGHAFQVCINKNCDVHWKEERLRKEREAKRRAAAPASSSRARQDDGDSAWQRAERERKAAAAVWKSVLPRIVEAAVAAVRAATPSLLFRVIADVDADRYSADYKRAAKLLSPKEDAASLLQVVALACVLDDAGNGEYGSSEEEFRPTAKLLGIDVDALLASVQTSAQPKQPPKTKAAGAAKKPAVKASAAKKAATKKPKPAATKKAAAKKAKKR